MTKKTKNSKAIAKVEKVEEILKKEAAAKPVEPVKTVFHYLASKANHIIEIEHKGQITFIQPFGKIKVEKSKLKIKPNDAKFLTFIKL